MGTRIRSHCQLFSLRSCPKMNFAQNKVILTPLPLLQYFIYPQPPPSPGKSYLVEMKYLFLELD